MNILCGYNVNIDSVYSISGDEVSELLRSQDVDEIAGKINNPPAAINSVSDFLAGLILCMKEGSGAEWLIHEKAVFDFLKENFFGKSLIRMGGNAGIMANVLSEMGAVQVVPNVVKPSRTQVSLFSKKAIVLPRAAKPGTKEDNRGEDTRDSEDTRGTGDTGELVHFVFDFKKGETFSLHGTAITVPRENRFIATYDSANIELAIDPDFDRYARQHIKEMDGALISGFHMLMDIYPDGSTYVEKLNRVIEQISMWKQLNSKLMIHAEFGHFSSRDLACDVFSKLSGIVDSIGLNEDELAMLFEVHGVPVDRILKMEAGPIIDAAAGCASVSGLKRMMVHTREFVMSVSASDAAEPVRELEAMAFGVKCAAAFAASGKLVSREFIEDVSSGLCESRIGAEQVQEVMEYLHGKRHRHGVWGEYKEYTVCVLPTTLCDNAIATVGLGDTVAAATFLRGLELHKGHV